MLCLNGGWGNGLGKPGSGQGGSGEIWCRERGGPVGGAEAEASSLTAETVSNGDPTFAGPLAGVQLGLPAYHVVEPEVKEILAADVYEEQIAMMEMVLDVEQIIKEVSDIRARYAR